MNEETLYTVADEDGEGRELNLTLREAAQSILQHDGRDFDIRPDGDGWRLWAQQEVAGIRWHGCALWSYCNNATDAEDDIFWQIIQRAVAGQGWGKTADKMDCYLAGLREMHADAA